MRQALHAKEGRSADVLAIVRGPIAEPSRPHEAGPSSPADPEGRRSLIRWPSMTSTSTDDAGGAGAEGVGRAPSAAAVRMRRMRARQSAGIVQLQLAVSAFNISEALFDDGRLDDWRTIDGQKLAAAVGDLLLDYIAAVTRNESPGRPVLPRRQEDEPEGQ